MKHKFRLLSKVVFFYSLFTLLFFIISAFILQSAANKHMINIMEKRFLHMETWIKKKYIYKPHKFKKIPHIKIQKVDEIPKSFSPKLTDTLMMNEQTGRKSMHIKKITYFKAGNQSHKLIMFKESEELYKFKNQIFNILFLVFIVLLVFIIIVTSILSGYLFDPFRRILKKMEAYQIGQKSYFKEIKTTTREFDQLKKLFDKMRKRIENDYFQLKEYTENMSHELQTPLSIIQNKTEALLSENNLSLEQANHLKVIYDEIQQLSKLGSALNLITKIENQEFKNIKKLKTSPLIQNSVNKIKEIAEMKQLSIALQLNENHYLYIDPGLADILIRNLLKNALHYSTKNTQIRIQTHKNEMIFTNYGQKPDFPENEIFHRYKKGHENQSLGLGLAIVHKICKVSGLTINYQYKQGKHIFTITAAN